VAEVLRFPVDRALRVAASCAATGVAVVIWELLEFSADRLSGSNIQVSLANTMQDQLLGLAGGCAAVVAMLRSRR
jgi:hypothetical protein